MPMESSTVYELRDLNASARLIAGAEHSIVTQYMYVSLGAQGAWPEARRRQINVTFGRKPHARLRARACISTLASGGVHARPH
jgi:hypothetical protein